MSKVKQLPRIRTPDDDDVEDGPPPSSRSAAIDAVSPGMREKVATYAFGTVVCGAAMVAAAAWMGGSLGAFGQSVGDGVDAIVRSAGMGVERVAIVGLEPNIEERARKAAAIADGDNMFRADPGVIRARVEALETVASVRVHRLWPDQITIVAETREPLALWGEGDGWKVIDQRGRAFAAANPEDFMQLPRVTGVAAGEATPNLVALISEFPNLADRMRGAERVGQRRWDVMFAGDHRVGDVRVAFPEDAELKSALARVNLLAARNRLLDLPASRIDARHPERLDVRPLPGTTLAGVETGEGGA
jgi:cell division protein FtsQ